MEELLSALRDLSDPEQSRRLAASRLLERAARSVSSGVRQKALGHQAATAALTQALADADPKVVQNAVIALAEISRRYFKDEQAYPALVRQLKSSDALTRLWAAGAAVTLRGAAAWPDVQPLARDCSRKVRAEVIRLAGTLAQQDDLPTEVREQLQALVGSAATTG